MDGDRKRYIQTSSEKRFENCDIDCKVPIFPKMLSHRGFKNETVIASDNGGYSFVYTAWFCLPGKFASMTH